MRRIINMLRNLASNILEGRRLSKKIKNTIAEDNAMGRSIAHSPSLSKTEADRLSKLSTDRCVITGKINFDRRPMDVQTELVSLCENSAEIKTSKSFFKAATINVKNHEAALNLLLPGHKEDIHRLVYYHFEYVPVLESIQIIRSVYVGDQATKSQLYHLDYNATNVLKLFIYLSDVDNENDGPFSTIILPKMLRRFVPIFPVHKSRNVEAILSFFGKKLTFYGPAGSSFLVQTSHAFHAGSRVAKNHERLAAIITFRSPNRLRGADNVDAVYPQPEVFDLFKKAIEASVERKYSTMQALD